MSVLQSLALMGSDPNDQSASEDGADEVMSDAAYSPRASQRLTEMLEKLREQRVEPTERQQWLGLASALLQPTSPGGGRFGKVMGNVTNTLSKYEAQREADQQAKDAMIAKYELALATLDDRANTARLNAATKLARRRTSINPVTGAVTDLDTGETIGPAGAAAGATRFGTGTGAQLMQKYPNLQGLDPNQLYKYDTASGEAAPIKVEAEKPTLPAPALARQTTLVNEAGQLLNTADEAQRIIGLINTNSLKLGPVENLASKAKLLAGQADPNAENYASLERFVNASVNSILNIAKGPQTEGDARRAQRQILRNLNDPQAVASGLAELRRLMLRELNSRDAQLQGLYRNYKAEPMTLWEAMGAEAPGDYKAPTFKDRTAPAKSAGALPPDAAARAEAIRRILEERKRKRKGQ